MHFPPFALLQDTYELDAATGVSPNTRGCAPSDAVRPSGIELGR